MRVAKQFFAGVDVGAVVTFGGLTWVGNAVDQEPAANPGWPDFDGGAWESFGPDDWVAVYENWGQYEVRVAPPLSRYQHFEVQIDWGHGTGHYEVKLCEAGTLNCIWRDLPPQGLHHTRNH